MRIRFFIIFLSILIFAGCRPVSKPVSPEDYFNLSEFMDNEIARLSTSNFVAEKHIFFNGEQEYKLEEYVYQPGIHPDTLELQKDFWRRELQPFYEADINKPSWAGSYTSDTIYSDGRISAIHYNAISGNVRTRKMEISFGEDGLPENVNATLFTKNTLYQSKQNLVYSRSEGYAINGIQKIRFFDADEFRIRVAFLEL